MVQHFDMQQVWKKPTQVNRVLLTELQDKRSIHKVKEEEANRKNTETLPVGTYTELANQISFGIATSKGCERPKRLPYKSKLRELNTPVYSALTGLCSCLGSPQTYLNSDVGREC